MQWVKVIVMCTIYLCIASTGVIGSPQQPKFHIGNVNDVCFTWECLITESWIVKNMNSSVDPCDDFYEFTCGRFGKGPTSSGAYAKDVFAAANDELDIRLEYIIENVDKETSAKPFKLVKILYDNCMNRNENGWSVDEIQRYFNRVTDLFGWPVVIGEQWRNVTMSDKVILPVLLKVNLYPDMEDSKHVIPWIQQGRRVLELEILRMGFTNEIVQAYYKYMVDIAVMFGADRERAKNELQAALLAEIRLANDTLSEEDRWITHHAHTRTTVGEFVDKYPNLHIREFVYSHVPRDYKLTDNDVIMVPKDFDNVEKVLSQTPKRVMANLVWWLRVESSMASVAEEFRDRTREFNSLIERPDQRVDKWKQCVAVLRSNLGLSLSALYQRRYIDERVVSDTNEMATFVHQKMREIVQEAKWLDSASKKEALQKVANIIGVVSFRNEYRDDKKLEEFYEDLELVDGDIQESIANITAFLSDKTYSYALERDHWTLNGNLVSTSALYNPNFNTYRVPAGFVLSDYYDLHRPKFINYATLGFTIAHEMSHSLDSNGIFIDKNANLREWRSSQSKEKFDERVKCMIDQYGNYTVDEVGLKVRAYHTLDENIADNFGIKAAYRAYLQWASQNEAEKLLPGLVYTPKQLFWIGIGNTWCTDYKNLELMNVVLADDHSPAKFRVNGALANRPEFSNDFGCKIGSKMNPVKKCSVW